MVPECDLICGQIQINFSEFLWSLLRIFVVSSIYEFWGWWYEFYGEKRQLNGVIYDVLIVLCL